MTGDDNGNVWKIFRIEGIGMVANVNELDAAKFSQSPRKNNEFVNVACPFPEEDELRRDKACEMCFGTRQFCRNSKFGQFALDHFAEALHALLLIRRKITDQQNHCDERRQCRGDGQRRPIGREPIAAGAAQSELAQFCRVAWKRDRGR